MRQGVIIANGIVLQSHELATVVLLTVLGFDVTLIPKSNKRGEKTPDIMMSGLMWEIKCPKGSGKWLIKNTIQKASHQSENIVLDLRRIKIHQAKYMPEIERYFAMSKRIKRIKVILKTKKVLDFVK